MRQESHGVERYDCSSGAGWPQTADSVTSVNIQIRPLVDG